jgi:PAT family beta-lactamase induction signal transducer AmpG
MGASTTASIDAAHYQAKKRHLLHWVPSLYISMGFPAVMVGTVAAIMYKNMGVSTEDIAIYTSQLYLPWVLKPLWAPFLETFRSKRFWLISMQFLITSAFGLVAFSLPHDEFFALSLTLFWAIGFASATQDIVIDGIFMSTASPREQASYAGLQGMCWNIGSVLGSGLIVALAGVIHDNAQLDWTHSWLIIMVAAGIAMGGAAIWHVRTVPPGSANVLQAGGVSSAYDVLVSSWATFFRKPHIWMMILVVFTYRIGEALIEKLGPLFLLDSREAGGLALNNQLHGLINGSAGTAAFILGTFCAGYFVSRYTLRKSFLALALALNVPHLTYLILSLAAPTDIGFIASLVILEKFGYGMGSVGHMLYMVQQVSPGPFRMSHYAIATAIMAMTRWLMGWISGPIYNYVDHDYTAFFAFAVIASVPPVLIAARAPFPVESDPQVNSQNQV